MRVWVTRAEPGASATAKRLRAAGHDPLVAPLLAIRFLAPLMDLNGVAALAFTSANGVRAFSALSEDRALPVFAVGDATAQAARAAGFARVRSASGDVRGLAALIEAERAGLPGEVLHPGARALAGDLAGTLTAAAVSARAVAVYEAAPAALSAETLAVLPSLDAVLIHSPRAAQLLAETAAPRTLRACCISAAAAAPLAGAGFRRIDVAARPDEESLLALLEAPSHEDRPFRLTPAFWILLAFGLACVVGGGLVAWLGPRL